MKELPKYLTVKQSDGSVWGVPVEMVARNRAEFYAHLHGHNIEQSLQKNTVPLFASDPYEIFYWARKNMNWKDFDGHQVQLSLPEPVDFQEGWLSGEKGLQLTMKVTKRKAPWTDHDGNELFEGDIIEHPNGERGRIEFHRRFASVSDQWRVDYGDGALSRLCLQIGDKGRAVKMACGGIKEEENGQRQVKRVGNPSKPRQRTEGYSPL